MSSVQINKKALADKLAASRSKKTYEQKVAASIAVSAFGQKKNFGEPTKQAKHIMYSAHVCLKHIKDIDAMRAKVKKMLSQKGDEKNKSYKEIHKELWDGLKDVSGNMYTYPDAKVLQEVVQLPIGTKGKVVQMLESAKAKEGSITDAERVEKLKQAGFVNKSSATGAIEDLSSQELREAVRHLHEERTKEMVLFATQAKLAGHDSGTLSQTRQGQRVLIFLNALEIDFDKATDLQIEAGLKSFSSLESDYAKNETQICWATVLVFIALWIVKPKKDLDDDEMKSAIVGASRYMRLKHMVTLPKGKAGMQFYEGSINGRKVCAQFKVTYADLDDQLIKDGLWSNDYDKLCGPAHVTQLRCARWCAFASYNPSIFATDSAQTLGQQIDALHKMWIEEKAIAENAKKGALKVVEGMSIAETLLYMLLMRQCWGVKIVVSDLASPFKMLAGNTIINQQAPTEEMKKEHLAKHLPEPMDNSDFWQVIDGFMASNDAVFWDDVFKRSKGMSEFRHSEAWTEINPDDLKENYGYIEDTYRAAVAKSP